MSERTMEGQGRAEQMRAMLAVGGSLSRSIAAMQAAWIEWRHGRGADAAMQWIENTLIGPGLIPGDDESDAQAFFDAAIAEIEEHRRGVEAEIAALAAPEPGGEGETLESRAYEVAHWIATEARVAESLDRSVAPIESEGARRIVALASVRPTPADVREQAAADVDEIWYHWIEGQEDLAIAALRKASDEELARFLDMLARWQTCPMPSDHDVAAALRSEAQGEGGIHPDPETWRCRQCGGYAAHYRDCPALRSEAQGEDELAALVVHMWQLKEQRGPMYTESGDFYADFRRAYELAAARTNGGSDTLRRYVEAPKAHICDGGGCGLEPCAETPAHREPGHARTVRLSRAARRGEGGGE